MKYLRRIAIAFAAVVIIVPLLILTLVFVVYHRGEPPGDKSSDPPGQGIIIAEIALPDDDAVPRIAQLVAPMNEVVKSRNCLGLKASLDWDCVNAVLKDGTTTLLAFEEWRSGPSLYKLQRPQDLRNRIRVPGPCFCADVPPVDWMSFQTLAKLLTYRALKKLNERNYEGAEQDFHAIFVLGTLLQHNPILVEHMIAMAVYRIGIWVIVKHVPPEAITAGYASFLPESKQQVEAMRFVLGAEWRGIQENLWQAVHEVLP